MTKTRRQKNQTTPKQTKCRAYETQLPFVRCEWVGRRGTNCYSRALYVCSYTQGQGSGHMNLCGPHKQRFEEDAKGAMSYRIDKIKYVDYEDNPPTGRGVRISYDIGFRPNIDYKQTHVALVEFVCTGCLESKYIRVMAIQTNPLKPYPDLECFEEQLLTAKTNKHIAPHFSRPEKEIPDGWAHCGYWKAVRLWKIWENPNGHSDTDSSATKDSGTGNADSSTGITSTTNQTGGTQAKT